MGEKELVAKLVDEQLPPGEIMTDWLIIMRTQDANGEDQVYLNASENSSVVALAGMCAFGQNLILQPDED